MKLFICKFCGDIIQITYETRYCRCNRSYGRYMTNQTAMFSGGAVPFALANSEFLNALMGEPNQFFTGFFYGLDISVTNIVLVDGASLHLSYEDVTKMLNTWNAEAKNHIQQEIKNGMDN